MARTKTLTDVEVAELCAEPNTEGWQDGLYRAGPHLFIQVRGNSTTWQVRWYNGPRVTTMGLGSTLKVTPTTAKRLRDEALAHVEAGRDPRAIRDAARPTPIVPRDDASSRPRSLATFQDAARQYIAVREKNWSRSHAMQWAQTMRDFIYPSMGAVPLAEITVNHIVDALQPIWSTKYSTAERLLQRIKMVLEWAEAERVRTGAAPADFVNAANPKIVKTLLGDGTSHVIRHRAALAYTDVPALWEALVADGSPAADVARFIILTAVRTSEGLRATWNEIDLERRVWTVPIERMKMRREHRVPLSNQAMELLQARPPSEGLVFTSPRGGPLGRNAPCLIIQSLSGTKVTAHGLRTTFSAWCDEVAEVPADIRERCLAHESRSATVRAYSRTDFLERRRVVMQRWADFVAGRRATSWEKYFS